MVLGTSVHWVLVVDEGAFCFVDVLHDWFFLLCRNFKILAGIPPLSARQDQLEMIVRNLLMALL